MPETLTIRSLLNNTAYIGALLIAIGLPLFPALQSIGVALVFLHPFLNNTWREVPRQLWKNKMAFGLAAYYILTLLTLVYTHNLAQYLVEIRIKLPFLLVAVGLCMPAISERKRWMVVYVLTGAVFITGMISFLMYLNNFDQDNILLIHSKPIPVFNGINHIYYGVLLAFSACTLLYLMLSGQSSRKTYWVMLELLGFVLMVVFLHTISSRTGLLCFYGGLGLLVLWYVLVRKKYISGLIMAALAGIVLVVSLKYVPSLQNRISNTREDLGRYYDHKDINHYSIAMRFAALKTAMEVFRESPVVGVGPADIEDEMVARYEADHSPLLPENRKLPHNQFIETLVSTGAIGFLLLLFIAIFPLFKINWKENALFLVFLAIMLLSMQTESMLERQVGVTFFVLFYMMLPRVRPVGMLAPAEAKKVAVG